MGKIIIPIGSSPEPVSPAPSYPEKDVRWPREPRMIHVIHHHVYHRERESTKNSQDWRVLANPLLWLFFLTTVGMLVGAL